MATNPILFYTFNEDDTSTIRDYSESGNDGTGSNLTIQNSTRVGKEVVFNGANDKISLSTFTELDGLSSASIHMGIIGDVTTSGTKQVLYRSGQLDVTYDGSTITFNLTVASGTATVSTTLIGNYVDYEIVYDADVLTLYDAGKFADSDDTQNGAIATGSGSLFIGKGAVDSAFFSLNEIKIFRAALSVANMEAFAAEQNGVLSNSSDDGEYQVGDLLVSEYYTNPYYFIVTYVGTNREFRVQPLSDNSRTGLETTRAGHLWDTSRQWAFIIDDTPQICFYDGISKSSEVFAASKKVYCLNKDGILKNSSTKTANYTTVSTDQRIYVDSSGGAFTITLEASPTTDKEIEIIDSTGNCQSFNVTIAGNGNNIVGAANWTMSTDYEGLRLIFNGTNWNLN